ncbi:MAG: ATP-binding protein [Bacteroidia bacterium]|nr:ATP-binding protein [Bacteroidia bacterium]
MIPHLSFRTRLLLVGMTITAAALVAFVYVEVTQSRDELLAHATAEAETLVETLNLGSAMNLLTTREMETFLLDRLVVAARLVDHIGEHMRLDESALTEELRNSDLDLILVLTPEGRIVSGASSNGIHPAGSENAIHLVAKPVLEEEYQWYAAPAVSLPVLNDTLFLLAASRQRGGAIVVGVRSSFLLDLRKRLGIGRLVRDIGDNPDIAYVVLQDVDGIVTASAGIDTLSAIVDDPFLLSALSGSKTATRITDTDDGVVLEVVRPLHIPEREPMLSRVGVSLARVRDIQQRSMRRVIMLAGGLFLCIVLVAVFLSTRARLSLLHDEHRRMRGSTDVILDNIADAVVAVDPGGRVTGINRAAMEISSARGSTDESLPYDSAFPGDLLLLNETANAGPIAYREQTIRTEQGSRIYAIRTSVVLDAQGRPDVRIAVARDLTEHRRAVEQLQRKDKVTAMGELAGGIAHEIRNPLNAIGIIAQRFQQEFVPSQDVDEYRGLAATMRTEVERVNAIITQFLAFARPPRPVFSVVDLEQLVDQTIQTVRSQARAVNIDVLFISEARTMILGDADRLQQALLNILQNAIEAIGTDGRIKCVLCRADSHAVLSVADTGPGIPEHIKERMFNLYFTTKPEGSGLGLGMVQQIVSEHGGELHVLSEPGVGATFVLRFSLAGGNPA